MTKIFYKTKFHRNQTGGRFFACPGNEHFKCNLSSVHLGISSFSVKIVKFKRLQALMRQQMKSKFGCMNLNSNISIWDIVIFWVFFFCKGKCILKKKSGLPWDRWHYWLWKEEQWSYNSNIEIWPVFALIASCVCIWWV